MEFSLDVAMIASITVGFLFYTGFGIARLLACESMRGQELLIAPLVGFSLSVVVGYWCGWLRWSASVGLVVVLCLATLLNVLALVQRRSMPLRVREHLPFLALAFCMLVMGLYPLWPAGVLRPIGSNGDQVVYVNLADYLERHTFPSPPPSGRHPITVQLYRVSEYGFPIGLSYLHAFVDKLSFREAHQTFSLVTAVAVALSVLVYACLAICLCGAGRLASSLAALFVAVSPLLLWVHYNNYGMHAIGLGLVPLAFGVAVLTLEDGRGLPLLPALLLSAAFVTYPPAAVLFAVCPTVLYVALSCIQRRDRLAPALRGLFALFTLAVLLNLPGILHAGRFFLHMTDLEWVTQFGDLARHIPWAELYGLSHHVLLTQMSPVAFSTGLSSLLVVIALLCTFYGVWRTKGMGRRAFLALAILYGCFLFWLRYALDYPYGFFKALTFTTFPAFIGLALGIEHFVVRTKSGFGKRRMAIALPFVAVVVVTNLITLLALSRQVATTALDFPALASLSNIRGNIAYDESIHIRDARDTPLLWMTYFLKDYNLSFSHFTPYYPQRDWPFYQDAISSDLVLVNKDVSLAAPWASETVYENSQYRILRKDSRILAHLDFQEGGQALRRGDTIRLNGLVDRLAVDGQAFSLAPHVQSREVLRLGVLAPAGSVVKHNILGQEETILLAEDVSVLDWPIRGELSRISLTNEGARPLRLLGWLEVVAGGWTAGSGPVIPSIFESYQEEVMPLSGFFVVSGWHNLEEGQRRWTKEASLAIFRNPRRPVLLAIEGMMRPYPDVTPPTKATILLNGHALGDVDEPGAFRQTYLLPEGLLGSSAWGDLEITVDHTFSPKQLGLATDLRDLGLAITRVELVDADLTADVDLAADGVIDLGTPGARKHLGPGWSTDEQGERVTFVWAEGQESLLWASLHATSDYEVEIRLLPFRYPASLPQELKLYVNGHHLQDLSLPNEGWQTHSFRLPRSFLSEGINVFRFVYRYAVSPQEVMPRSHDRRRLAMAFDFMRFRPE